MINEDSMIAALDIKVSAHGLYLSYWITFREGKMFGLSRCSDGTCISKLYKLRDLYEIYIINDDDSIIKYF